MASAPAVSKQNINAAAPSDWDRVSATSEFKDLLAAKARFIVPATVFFIAYYFALPVLVGYYPELMKTRVIGPLNLAYLFALSQFAVAWLIAGLYMRRAERFDAMGKQILDRLESGPSGQGGR